MAVDIIDNAKMWLITAQATIERQVYPTALYSIEMSVELAVKGVMFNLGVDVPKVHNITPLIREIFAEKQSMLPKEFIENEPFIIDTFSILLDLRPAAGYAYERNINNESMKESAQKYVKSAAQIIMLCQKAIIHIQKNARK